MAVQCPMVLASQKGTPCVSSIGPNVSRKFISHVVRFFLDEERAEQGGSQLEFQDIESLPGDTLSLLRVEEATGYLPAPLQKKKRCSHHKTMDTNKEDLYLSFSKVSLGSDNGGMPWNPSKDDQMDIDNSGPLQM